MKTLLDRIEAGTMELSDECRSVKTIDAGVWRMAGRVHHRKRIEHKASRLKAVKYASIAVLLATAVFWSYAMEFQFLTRWFVALSALAVTFQALRTKSYGLAVLLAIMVLLFNPIVPVFEFSGPPSLVIVLLSAIPFFISLRWMKTTLAERDRMSGTQGL